MLLSLGRSVAIHYAAKADLKVDFRLEGSVFGGIVIRNLRVVPTAPTTVESIDADYVRVDYTLLDLLRRRLSDAVKNVEVRSARVVLNTDKTPVKPKLPKPDERIILPAIFPEQVRLSDVNLTIRTSPHDFVMEHLYVDLLPHAPGELRVAQLRIPNAQSWKGITAQTSYTNKNLVLRGLVLDPLNQIRLLDIDASRIRTKQLEAAFDLALAEGTVAGSIGLTETPTSLDTKVRIIGQNISVSRLADYIGKPAGALTGRIERIAIEGRGAIDMPRSWVGEVSASLTEAGEGNIALDSCVMKITARDGRANLEGADLTSGSNKIHLQGSAALPEHIREFGRSPALLDMTAELPDLAAITAKFTPPVTGAASLKGRLEISQGTLRADVGVTGSRISYGATRFETMDGSVRLSKLMPPANSTKVYYGDLQSETHFEITNVQSGDYVADRIAGDLAGANERVTLNGLTVERNRNRLLVHGVYRLPENLHDAENQPAQTDFVLQAPQAAEFFLADSPNKVSGPLEASGQLSFARGMADGQMSFSGTNLAFRTLLIPQVSAQCSIARSVVYLNDFTAKLNQRDFVAGSAVFDLQSPHRYHGKVSANITDLATVQPLLKAIGNDNALGGAFALDWQGTGNLADFKNSGGLRLKLERGRYGDLRALQANVEASYSPDGLDVPIVFLASDKMDFQASIQAKDSTLEISKIQIDQGKAKYGVGNLSMPFVWRNLGTDRPLFPAEGKVAGTFQSENLDLKRLSEDFGAKPIASGLVNVKLDAQGTLENLRARADLQVRDLRFEQSKNLEPATFDLTLQTQENRLALSGTLKQAKIQPLQFEASMPLNLARIARERKFDEQTLIAAKLQLPRSSVNFLRQFAPPIQELDGDLALDVKIDGTIARPVLSGAG
ncbi:MAG: hypothetical protein H0U99_08960, partial [Chthoniobacterales bacterium]|nr:hypothetical protein [Chthoniobacterales bacterium]